MAQLQAKIELVYPGKKKLFFRQRYERLIDDLIKDLGKQIEEDMLKPARTWSSLPLVSVKTRGNSIEVFTVDKRWIYLNEGTSVRWAVMSNPFVSKTVSGSLNSRSGTGGKVGFIQPGTGIPRAGIAARGWLPIIAENAQETFNNRYRRILLQTLWV